MVRDKKMTKQRRTDDRYILGIESTADDFGVGISTFNGEILANAKSAYIPQEGGIHPREAARHHAENASNVLQEAFQQAKLRPCLRTGATVSRALATYLGIPLVGVNHCVAHIEIGKLKAGARDPVTLYVSGGNTMVTAFDSGRYRVFGETLDIALGNCLDVFAREAGLRQKAGVPFGAAIEKLAVGGRELVPLPYTVKGMDISLSGLLTAATGLLKDGKCRLEDLCYSLQETAFSMVTEVTERALAHTEKNEVLLTGGVAANRRLQSMIKSIAQEHRARFCVVPSQFAVDNGAMIAWTGALAYGQGLVTPVERSFVKLRWRLEEVDVPWLK
jgi:universal protein Kae1